MLDSPLTAPHPDQPPHFPDNRGVGGVRGGERWGHVSEPWYCIRNGTTSLFAALDSATGAVIGKCYKRNRATEFLDVLKKIDAAMPEGPDVHLVMDNYATHKTPKVKDHRLTPVASLGGM